MKTFKFRGKSKKDGDVLCDYSEEYNNPLIFILKKFEHVNFGLVKPSDYTSYCFLTAGNRQKFKKGTYHHKCNIKPATKEQRDLLFQKMKEAGYEWNAEKKELKKIKKKIIEIPFGTDSELIEETITIPNECYAVIEDNKVILRKGEQKPAWSEEDERYYDSALWHIKNSSGREGSVYNWLKSLKEKMKGE